MVQWRALVRAASLELVRINELCGEVDYVAHRIPVAVYALPDEGDVCVSLQYSFFNARSRLTLHLRVISTDPEVPLGWQLHLEQPHVTVPPPAAATDAVETRTALVAVEPLRLKIGAIVDAHATGFGRVRAIHAALVQTFCPERGARTSYPWEME